MLCYLPLEENPRYYVWDTISSRLFSAGYGKKVGSPNGLYPLKYSMDPWGNKGFRVTLIPNRNYRQTFSVYQIENMIREARAKNTLQMYVPDTTEECHPFGYMVGKIDILTQRQMLIADKVFDSYEEALTFCKGRTVSARNTCEGYVETWEIFKVEKFKTITIKVPSIRIE